MKNSSKVILALDVENFLKAKYFINKFYPRVKIFKIGLQLFTSCGPKIIRYINKKGAGVFLDLKFFDIPNTVSNAIAQGVRLKVKMLTLHISGAEAMLKAAVKTAKEESRRLNIEKPLLLGVTILTSQKAKPQTVLAMAKTGLSCGLDGVVCSAQEASFLKRRIKKRFIIITPGIRPKGINSDDQRRTATAAQAFAAGADFIVVGRPLLKAADPLRALKELI
ncbi:MAG: orotidine-5'-phosphate decarboxylase [Candidatus Omnitrophota bacterium]